MSGHRIRSRRGRLSMSALVRGLLGWTWGRIVRLVAGPPLLSREGLTVHTLVKQAEGGKLAQHVGAAINLVSLTDLRAYRRLRTHVDRIIVLPMQGMGRGAHVGGGRQVYLDEMHVQRSS